MYQIYLKLLCLLLTQIGKAELCPYAEPNTKESKIVVTDTIPQTKEFLEPPITQKYENAEDILWTKDRKLTWDDFQAPTDSTMPKVAALTFSSIIYRRSCENGQLRGTVQAVFKKKKSWVNPNMKTDYHLEHEQLHFDITELYARRLRGALEKYVFDCDQVLEFNRVVSVFLNEWKKVQHKYDIETIYSQNMQQQRDWYVSIHMQLLDYKAYAMVD